MTREQAPGRPVSRRALLTGGAVALGGAVVAGGAVAAGGDPAAPARAAGAADPALAVEPFHGPRQAGVATAPQAYASFVAFTLNRDTDRAALGRMLRLLTDDAARLTRGEVGLPMIPEFSHVARSHASRDRQRLLRRPYNHDLPPDAAGRPDSGMIFASYQADVAAQFLPIQRKLAEQDLMNEWTTPIGSAVCAIPPGCAPDGWIGEQVLG